MIKINSTQRATFRAEQFERQMCEAPVQVDTKELPIADDVQRCTAATRNIPIILLPGIMGSRLFFPDIGQFWDPDSKLAMSYWAFRGCDRVRQDLHHEAPAQVMTTQAIEIERIDFWGNAIWRPMPVPTRGWRGWESISTDFYRSMLTALDDYGTYCPPGVVCHAYAIGYDFRQSNLDSGRMVAVRVREILREENAAEYILVTHSMGGLVARSLLQHNPDLAKTVKRVIHIMQPAWGAPVFYYALFRGFPYGKMFEPTLGKALGDTGEEFMTVASGQRGAVELIPNNAYVEKTADGTWQAVGWLRYRTVGDAGFQQGWRRVDDKQSDVYDMYLLNAMDQPGLLWMANCIDRKRSVGSLSISGDLTARINEARAFHEKLRDFSAEAVTSAIYGTGLETCVGVDFTFDRNEHETFERFNKYGLEDRPGVAERSSLEGDNTVPSVSARGEDLAEDMLASTGIGHRDGCTTSSMIMAVKRNLCKLLGGKQCRP